MSQPGVTLEPQGPADRREHLDEPAELGRPAEPFLVAGRPVEDRSFEVVEAGVGISLGMAIGTAVAGPIGTAVGGVLGCAAGIVAGEALERVAGRAATTTDAADDESE